jgi:hypothetical protein
MFSKFAAFYNWLSLWIGRVFLGCALFDGAVFGLLYGVECHRAGHLLSVDQFDQAMSHNHNAHTHAAKR